MAFDDGVIIAADDLSTSGRLNKDKVKRVFNVNKKAIIGMSGDFADFETVYKSIEEKNLEDESEMDGKCTNPLGRPLKILYYKFLILNFKSTKPIDSSSHLAN